MRNTRVADCGGMPSSDTSIIILYIDFTSLSNGVNVVINPVIESENCVFHKQIVFVYMKKYLIIYRF